MPPSWILRADTATYWAKPPVPARPSALWQFSLWPLMQSSHSMQ